MDNKICNSNLIYYLKKNCCSHLTVTPFAWRSCAVRQRLDSSVRYRTVVACPCQLYWLASCSRTKSKGKIENRRRLPHSYVCCVPCATFLLVERYVEKRPIFSPRTHVAASRGGPVWVVVNTWCKKVPFFLFYFML